MLRADELSTKPAVIVRCWQPSPSAAKSIAALWLRRATASSTPSALTDRVATCVEGMMLREVRETLLSSKDLTSRSLRAGKAESRPSAP